MPNELKPFTPVRLRDGREGRIIEVRSTHDDLTDVRYTVELSDDERLDGFHVTELEPFQPDDIDAWSRERFPLDFPPSREEREAEHQSSRERYNRALKGLLDT